MKWTPKAAGWAISQLDAFEGDPSRALRDTHVILQSLAEYRFAIAEQAASWFVQLKMATPERRAERVAKVRAIAAQAVTP